MVNMAAPILQAKGITKIFPGVRALDNVDFDLYAGEVHILVGENGAGKSTLAKCILGAHHPEQGEIYLDGNPVSFLSPKNALQHGIAAVYQELTMVPYLNASQNIFLNREPLYKGTCIVNHKKMHEDAKELLDTLGCGNINLKKPVKLLGVADQQMIEIAKAMSFRPKIIVFDEPTATLSDRDVALFFKQVHKLKEQGIGIIYVSHRMKEFKEIGDRITVLRDGKYIKTIAQGELSDEELVNLMVGRDISQVYVRTPNHHTGDALRIENLCDKKGRVKNCSLNVRRGSIVGLAGLVGAGRTELAKLIFGIDKPASGKVYINGEDVTGKKPSVLVKNGVGFLPEDRKRFGLALNVAVSWNILAVSLKKYFPAFLVSQDKNEEIAMRYVSNLKIATPDVKRSVRALSGGNQQKVVISKWLSADTDIVIFDEPTRGIDVGAKMEIYALMDQLAQEGKAILMISSEMQEVVGMSDYIYIMNDGKFVGELNRESFDIDEVGRLMLLGKKGEEEEDAKSTA